MILFYSQYVWMYAQGIGSFPSRFEKLCNFVGTDVMPLIYNFMLHANTAQSERLETGKTSKKKKNKENIPEEMSTLGKVLIL